MHIPDGYLGPPTCIASYAACSVLWAAAARKIRTTLEARKAPLLAVSAAFSFLIMMFNIPVPGGTTGHAVGAVLIAIAIGPWAASLALTVALAIQAMLFGDGGITSFGANCFNLAFVMPFAGYASYQLLGRLLGRTFTSPRGKAISAGISGWIGLNAGAFTTALMFGIQPMLHTGADGQAIYAPYSLAIAVPAMMLEHVLLFGVIEGFVTGLAVYYLQRSRSSWVLERQAP